MIDTPAQRIALHRKLAEHCAEQTAEYDASSAAQLQVARAIHELGLTIAASVQVQRADEGELEQLGTDLVALSAAVDAHQAAITRATKGQMPWGELLRAGDALKLAVDKVLKR